MTARPPIDRAERWRAAGVRHALLLRVLPALRHDLATPISVVRMTTLLLQRKLASAPVDTGYCVQRLGALDQQADALTRVMGLLMEWNVDRDAAEPDTSRAQLVATSVGLLQPLWALEGVTIEVDPQLLLPAVEPAAPAPHWPGQTALRYLLLGALCYLHDAGTGSGRIRIEPDRDDGLRLHGRRGAAAAAESAPVAEPCMTEQREEPIRIDAEALRCLAADLGHRVGLGPDSVCLRLAAPSADVSRRAKTADDCAAPAPL